MTTRSSSTDLLIEKSYREYYSKVLRYMTTRISNVYDAENLTQDVWVRLLTLDKEIEEISIESLIFTIARNLVNDYLRRYYHRQEMEAMIGADMEETSEHSCESEVSARDLAAHEKSRVKRLPEQRRRVYIFTRYEGCTVEEIAGKLSLSLRTVENHLRMARKEVREYMAAIA